MSDIETGQVSTEAAELYEALFVPALFEPWAGHLVQVANAKPGDAAVDVGCGTGVLTRPYDLGERERLDELLMQAEVNANIETVTGQARFPSLERWLETDIRGWTLADAIDDTQYATLVDAARHELAQFVEPNGSVSFDAPAHIVVSTPRMRATRG